MVARSEQALVVLPCVEILALYYQIDSHDALPPLSHAVYQLRPVDCSAVLEAHVHSAVANDLAFAAGML